MKQQLEQLLKDAEEVTAKMREALARMDKPAINMDQGKWYRVEATWIWLIKFDKFEGERVIALDAVPLNVVTDCGSGYFCDIRDIKSYTPAIPEDMMLLPDGHPEKPKPALAATYEEVVEVVQPMWLMCSNGDFEYSYKEPYHLPNETSAKQSAAYIQIKNLEAYCADRFEGDKDCTIDVDDAGNLVCYDSVYGSIKVSFKAGQWLIENHPEPFLVFFVVKS